MKLSIAVAALAGALFLLPGGASANPAVGLSAAKATVGKTTEDVQSRRRYRRSRTEVIQTSPGIDPTTLALILGGGALTGGGNMMSLALPLLLSQPQETVIVERRGRRR